MDKRECSIEGCGEVVRCRELCARHYDRALRKGTLPPAPSKICSVTDCTTKHYSLGFCVKHYRRMQEHGSTDKPIVGDLKRWASLREKIEARTVKDPSGHWYWLGAHTPDGYGMVTWLSKGRPVHRAYLEELNGPIPPELHVDHLCRDRGCLNPDHLELVSPRENILRGEGIAAVNLAKTHCKHGHEFTEDNTLRTKTGRQCRTCSRIRMAKFRSKT